MMLKSTGKESSMVQIYRMNEVGGGESLERIHCTDEGRELQSALEQNYDLLPGDQIRPDNPCQWLLIRREMPVPDPASGQYRWNIDFLFGDQTAMPTFVECKRFNDTAARRTVVGQMMEYAANGHHYWTASELQSYAEQSAAAAGQTVEEALKIAGWEDTDAPESYFEKFEDNLREGQVRLVFFLEDASFELKSIVEFLNRQMERSEVLLVEARQYRLGSERIISPALFGFSEEARYIKRNVNVEARGGEQWTPERFFEQAAQALDKDSAEVLRRLLQDCEVLGCDTNWGHGKLQGSFTVRFPDICNQSLFSVYSSGRMELPFKSMGRTAMDQVIRDRLKDIVSDEMHLPLPEDCESRFPSFKFEQWGPKADTFVVGLRKLVNNISQ
jgi:hypothetical protein